MMAPRSFAPFWAGQTAESRNRLWTGSRRAGRGKIKKTPRKKPDRREAFRGKAPDTSSPIVPTPQHFSELRCSAQIWGRPEAMVPAASGGNSLNSGVQTLKHVSIPAAGVTPATTIPSAHRPKSVFASVLAALHHSRRIQARRILGQYRHLISHGDQRTALSRPNPEDRENVDR
jgi:hypothetical protein